MTTGYLGPVEHPKSGQPETTKGQSHYFSTQSDARSKRSRIRLDLPDLSVDLMTDRGVFSPDRVDPGTKLLLGELPVLPDGPLLDLGCGYGPIAVTLARRRPGQLIWAVDVSERAMELAQINLAANAPQGTPFEVGDPDLVPTDMSFAAIVSNPPIRVGKTVLHDMLDRWLPRLSPDSSAWLVVHRHLGADSLTTWLQGRGHVVERIRSRQGYRILKVTPGGPASG
ncbi:MAG: methyltransferase [Microthrixaceae bacterium]